MSVLRLIRRLSAAGLVLGLAAAPLRAAEPAPGLEVRTGLHKTFTRLVIESARPVPYKFSFPTADEIVVTVTGAALPKTAPPPRARGIIRAIEARSDDRGSRLVIRTRAPADIRRQFTLLPRDGQGARIVIDLAAADPAPAPARPMIMLPAPHTTITGTAGPTPAPAPSATARPKTPHPARPTAPFEVAATGGMEMLFDGGRAEALAQPVELAQQEPAHLELAQVGGLSVNDWLMREGGNPNVRQNPPDAAPADAVNPPAPPAYPAAPVYRAPVQQYPARPAPAQGPPAYAPSRTYAPPPAYTAQPAAQTHPSHPGYRTPQPAPTWAPPPRGQSEDSRGTEDGPAARYASQKQSVPAENQTLAPRRRFYGGFGLGMGMFDYESDLNNSTLDEHLLSWKLVGGFRPNDVLALELSYGKVGGFDEIFANGTSAESQFYAVTASALMSLPLNTNLTPFVRAGLSLWWESADSAASAVRTEETGTGAVLGLGADYRFSDRLSLRGEWEIYILSDTAYSNMFAASVLYNF